LEEGKERGIEEAGQWREEHRGSVWHPWLHCTLSLQTKTGELAQSSTPQPQQPQQNNFAQQQAQQAGMGMGMGQPGMMGQSPGMGMGPGGMGTSSPYSMQGSQPMMNAQAGMMGGMAGNPGMMNGGMGGPGVMGPGGMMGGQTPPMMTPGNQLAVYRPPMQQQQQVRARGTVGRGGGVVLCSKTGEMAQWKMCL
jgi:hypothetical protein